MLLVHKSLFLLITFVYNLDHVFLLDYYSMFDLVVEYEYVFFFKLNTIKRLNIVINNGGRIPANIKR